MKVVQDEAYQNYLRRLDARAILDHYGAERITEQLNKDGSTEIKHSCLIDRVHPHHANGDANPSACLNLDKRQYVCYSMGWGADLMRFVMTMENADTPREAIGFSSHFLTESVVPIRQMCDEVERLLDNVAQVVSMPIYDRSVIDSWVAQGHPEWNRRGITTFAIDMLNLGYDPRAHRLVFPHFWDGELVGWQKRAIPRETIPDFPKYRSSPGMPKSETIYGLDLVDRTQPLIVVESPMSVAKAYSLGLGNVVATFGAKVSKAQIALLRTFDRVVVWFDADPAGREGERRLLEGLYRHIEAFRIVPEANKDLGDHGDLQTVHRYIGQHFEPAALSLAAYDLISNSRRTRG
jgi:hypothetical protein